MDKREMTEKAFGRLYRQINKDHYCETLPDFFEYLLEALAKEIVIECEVEHGRGIGGQPYTVIHMTEQAGPIYRYIRDDHLGTPGKALAIIIPLDEK